MTVPFIMALGVGVSAVRNDREAGGDSFGLVAVFHRPHHHGIAAGSAV